MKPGDIIKVHISNLDSSIEDGPKNVSERVIAGIRYTGG